MRPDGSDGQVWKITAKDEAELGMERVALNDSVAILGKLDVGVEQGRIAYRVQARQVLFLRNRSIAKATIAAHGHQPASDGFARPRVG
jgi:hypothetical protein